MPNKVRMLDDQVVWMKFMAEEDVEEVLENAACKEGQSLFYYLERWMECMGSPPRPCWIKVKGVPFMFGTRMFLSCWEKALDRSWRLTSVIS